MERHTFELTGEENTLLLLVIAILLWFVFWRIPTIRRSGEGVKPLASFRVVATFGRLFFCKSGFYRITLYDTYFVAVFLGCEKIPFTQVRNLKLNKTGIPCIAMTVHGVEIRIYSELGQLQKLHKTLSKRIK